jgi:hypothetical protein
MDIGASSCGLVIEAAFSGGGQQRKIDIDAGLS